MTDKEANVDADDRAPLLSFPPKKNSVENAINTESEPVEAGGTRFVLSCLIIRCVVTHYTRYDWLKLHHTLLWLHPSLHAVSENSKISQVGVVPEGPATKKSHIRFINLRIYGDLQIYGGL